MSQVSGIDSLKKKYLKLMSNQPISMPAILHGKREIAQQRTTQFDFLTVPDMVQILFFLGN